MSRIESAYFGILYVLTGKRVELYSTAFLIPLILTVKGMIIVGGLHALSQSLSK